MSLDKGKHNTIRMKIIEDLGKNDFISSHEGEGNINFFNKFEGKKIPLAEPDIVIIKDNHVLVVEIELGTSPKRLMGVTFAIYSSEFGEYAKQPISIEQKSLLLVLDSEKIDKIRSQKPKQIQEIKSQIEKELKFEYFNIVTDKEVSNEIHKWITEGTKT